MAKAYETVIVFSVKEGDEAVAANVEKFKEVIAKAGSIENVDDWGKRRLAYPINYETEGHYVVIQYSAEPTFVAELARVLNISDSVIRYLTTTR